MSKKNFLQGLLVLLLVPSYVGAAPLRIDTGVRTSIPQIMAGFVNAILNWSGVIATGLFLLGAILMIGSAGNDQYLSAGKRIMKSAIIGFALVLASWMILSTVVYFIAG